MKRLLLAAAMLALAACSSAEVKAIDGIAATNARFEQTFNAGDAAGLAGLYTAGAVVMAPGYLRIRGRRAIQGLWQRFFDAGDRYRPQDAGAGDRRQQRERVRHLLDQRAGRQGRQGDVDVDVKIHRVVAEERRGLAPQPRYLEQRSGRVKWL